MQGGGYQQPPATSFGREQDTSSSSTAAGTTTPFKMLSPSSLIRAVQGDPGKTAAYYATRYFGKEQEPEVNHLLWTQIKRFGLVQVERPDGPNGSAIWVPTYRPKNVSKVFRHNPDDEDLSVLRHAPLRNASSPSSVLSRGGRNDDDFNNNVEGSSPSFGAGSIIHRVIEELLPDIVSLVMQAPGKDIHYYIRMLPEDQRPVAALAFKRLRQEGRLERYEGGSGSFRWRVLAAAPPES
jgi:hypothetical protein